MGEGRQKMPRGYSVRTLPGFAVVAIFTLLVLYAPIMILVAYSFNAGSSLAIWEGFSLRWYAQAAANEAVQDAALRSLFLAISAATAASSPPCDVTSSPSIRSQATEGSSVPRKSERISSGLAATGSATVQIRGS